MAAAGMLAIVGCGSRTGFQADPGPPPPPECIMDADCDGFGDRCSPVACQAGACTTLAPVDCDDHDPCTSDICDSTTGQCSHPSATFDLDGDGHLAPLPGKRAGEPGSCGDDCDDTNPHAFPGGIEICDGVDNDCNGIVDDGASLSAAGDTVKVSEAPETHPASLGYSGADQYLAAYAGEVTNRNSVFLTTLSKTGTHPKTAAELTAGPADADGGPLAWTGDRFGIAWSDRRDARGTTSNYEVYFNLVNPDGTKRMPDVRVTYAVGFSINVALAWTGHEFVALWQDDGMNSSGKNEIFGQRIDVNGALIGGNIKLIDDQGPGQTAPSIAVGQRSLGVTWMRGDATLHDLMFAPFDYDLQPLATPVSLTGNMAQGISPIVVYNQAQYIIAWYDPDSTIKTVYGAVRGELGEPLVARKAISDTPRHARYPALLAYGDRELLVWSDDRDQNLGYELYAKTLDKNLNTLTPEERLTNATGDSVDPHISFGPSGEVGILFGDNRTGQPEVYFTHLSCVSPPAPPPSP